MEKIQEAVPSCQCGFVCSICGEVANLVQMFVSDTNIKFIRSGFLGKGEYNRTPEVLGRASVAILSGSARAVHAFELELLPGYCPTCDAIYCADHWDHWVRFDDEEPGWVDSIRGRCPGGHERMLED